MNLPSMTHPNGDSDVRLVKKAFKKCFQRAKRLQEYFFRLESAASITSGQKSFIQDWLAKLNIVQDIEKQLSNCESALLKASSASGVSLPSFLNLTSVRAVNKFGGGEVSENKPQDVREAREGRKRRRQHESMLEKLQTPLVEANRPNKRNKSERSRHQANYQARRSKTKIPVVLHPQLETQRE